MASHVRIRWYRVVFETVVQVVSDFWKNLKSSIGADLCQDQEASDLRLFPQSIHRGEPVVLGTQVEQGERARYEVIL